MACMGPRHINVWVSVSHVCMGESYMGDWDRMREAEAEVGREGYDREGWAGGGAVKVNDWASGRQVNESCMVSRE